jgi:hypothetical protein
MRTGLAVAILAFSAQAARAEDLTFVAPEGFHSITEEQLPILGAMSNAAPRARRALAVADEEGGTLRAVMIALVVPVHDGESVELPLPRDLERELRSKATTNAARQGATVARLDTRTIKVRGVDTIRIISTPSVADRDEHHVVYYLPGNEQVGVVTCISSTADAAHYDPLFQAAIERTIGLRQPAWWARPLNKVRAIPAERVWMVLPILLLSYLISSWRRRRQREAAGLPPRR